MNDLELVAALDDSTEPDPVTLQRGLDELMTAISAQDVVRPTARRALTPRSARRPWGLAAVAAVAAVALVAVVIQGRSAAQGPTLADPRARPSASVPELSGPASSLPVSSSPSAGQVLPTGPTGDATAGDSTVVLRRAAAVVLAEPPLAPRADQFLYVTTGSTYEAWLSIDGTHDGEVRNGQVIAVPGCVGGIASVGGNAPTPRPQACAPDPAYWSAAPTDAQGMADELIRQASGRDAQGLPIPPSPNQQGKLLLSVLQFRYLLPAARAALFQSLPLLPGLGISAAELPGRNAIAVSWSYSGATHSLLFDSATFEYLGFSYSAPGSTDAGAAAVMTQRIVDAVGLRS